MAYSLTANLRTVVGRKVSQVRKNGQIPAVVYGNGTKTRSIAIDNQNFFKLFDTAGTSTIIDLKVDDSAPIKVLIREPQIDPVTMRILHVDFHQINMKEKIRTEVPLEFIGDSPAVVDLDGKLVYSLDNLEIECLPDDLVQHIDVDISVLKEFDDSIHVSDIKAPQGIEILNDPELSIVVVQAPISEAELEAELAEETSEAEAVAAVEVEEKGALDEEAVEGEPEKQASKEPDVQ